jgi:hypothetical protein
VGPFHGFEYDTSGAVVCIPANGKAAAVPFDRYVTHQDRRVVVT